MERKPEWLRVRYNQQAVSEVAELMRDLKLNTVCKAANCPNLGECYQKHTATFMIWLTSFILWVISTRSSLEMVPSSFHSGISSLKS